MREAVVSEEQLILLASRGDPVALQELSVAHRPGVLRIALHLLGDEDAAQDVTQDAFVRLQNALAGFRGEAELSTWLYRVTLNLCRDQRRKGQRRLEVPLEEAGALHTTTTGDPTHEVAVGRARQAIQAALERLPASQREVVTLRFIAELRYVEIARITGLPEGTVASRVFRALRVLSREIEPIHLEIVR